MSPYAPNTLLTPDEVVEHLDHQISVKTLANWRSVGEGRGPAFKKLGGRALYPFVQLQAWMQENEFKATWQYAQAREATRKEVRAPPARSEPVGWPEMTSPRPTP